MSASSDAPLLDHDRDPYRNERLPPPITSEQIYLRWAQRADLPEMTRILVVNGLLFELHDHFAPTRHLRQDEYYSFFLHRLRMFWCRSGVRFLVAEKLDPPDENDEGRQKKHILGFAAWVVEKDSPLDWCRVDDTWSNRFESYLLSAERLYHQYTANTLFDIAGMNRMLARLHVDDHHPRPSMHLQFLFVEPTWQRTPFRIGHMLLQWGIDLADRVQLPIILVASLAGYPFYLKHGFEQLETIHIDLIPEIAYDMPIVIRYPNY